MSSSQFSCPRLLGSLFPIASPRALQITTIQQAVSSRTSNMFFEGSRLKLKWSCSIHITMNPGYAGREELPDNLKVCGGGASSAMGTACADPMLLCFGSVRSRAMLRCMY